MATVWVPSGRAKRSSAIAFSFFPGGASGPPTFPGPCPFLPSGYCIDSRGRCKAGPAPRGWRRWRGSCAGVSAPACASRRSRRRTRRLPHVRRARGSPAPRSRSGTFGAPFLATPPAESPPLVSYTVPGSAGGAGGGEAWATDRGDRGRCRIAGVMTALHLRPARLPGHPRGPVGARALPRQLLGLHPHPPRDPRQRRAVHPLGAGSPAPLAGAASGARCTLYVECGALVLAGEGHTAWEDSTFRPSSASESPISGSNVRRDPPPFPAIPVRQRRLRHLRTRVRAAPGAARGGTDGGAVRAEGGELRRGRVTVDEGNGRAWRGGRSRPISSS